MHIIMKRNKFINFADLKAVFGSVDKAGDCFIFNIGGNKLRLIANIHFISQRVYIRAILLHRDYDKNNWRTT
jgi:mRNA interferase HigB